MNKVHELRIRPVERYLLTEHKASEFTGSTITIGEFASLAHAERVALAIAQEPSEHPEVAPSVINMATGKDGKFVIVRAHDYEPETVAYYAYSKKAAKELKAKLETDTGREFKIYRQEGV